MKSSVIYIAGFSKNLLPFVIFINMNKKANMFFAKKKELKIVFYKCFENLNKVLDET